ncbi:MAG: sugar phosphate isomerase/epimerase family protein [Clostridia bacterium]
MKLATRINSFYDESNTSLLDVINEISKVREITHVDLNYPEHFNQNSISSISKTLKDNNLKLNGVAPRFRDEFKNGEFSNSSDALRRRAIEICKESIDVCRELGGEVITIWLGYDGYDYPFQMNYTRAWNKIVDALREICLYAGEMKVSIEYKPYQPRVYSLISSFGDVMMLLKEVGCSNIGITLDFCHMIMKGENPSFGLSMAAEQDKLYGIHLNDGNKLNDDGLMIGTINLAQTLEFVYYLKKYKYNETVYFDTFPVRENPVLECEANAKMFKKISNLIDDIGMNKIQAIIDKTDAIEVQKLLMEFLR